MDNLSLHWSKRREFDQIYYQENLTRFQRESKNNLLASVMRMFCSNKDEIKFEQKPNTIYEFACSGFQRQYICKQTIVKLHV